ncbi:MAG TPA: LamG-like jellyroll fold domain-containing protein [Bacteroidales bacterium]|nr:LamG-like jellyroll fold domain-containing protein [Bacteroidales bacterium]
MNAVNKIKKIQANDCISGEILKPLTAGKLPAVFLFFVLVNLTCFAQTGPGGVGSAESSSSLKMWLRADRNVSYDNLKNVISWTDFSSNGHVLSGSGTNPLFVGNSLNLMPAVNFNSDAAGLKTAALTGSLLFSSAGNTIFFVKKSVSGSCFFDWQSSAVNQVSFTLSGNKEVFNFPDNSTGSLTGNTDISGNWHILTNTIDGSNQSIYLDGITDAVKANTLSLNTSSSANLFIGTLDGTATGGWTGLISELIIFNNSLNTASRILIENYLSAKYNIPVSNDHYAGDDAGNGNYDQDVAGIGAETDGKNSASNSSGMYLRESFSNPLTGGNYILSGHSGALKQVTSSDVSGGAELRWNRSWFIDKTGTTGARISFDLSEGIDGGTPGNPTGYVLLYRPSVLVNFAPVTSVTASVENSDQIYFDIENADLNDGFYTLGTTSPNNSPLDGIKTWYNYSVDNTDDWDNWERWTLDPDGSMLINPSHLTPGASDDVVIMNGGTINISGTDLKSASSVEIRKGGVLVISTASPSPEFDIIKGEGTIRLSENNYPGDGVNDTDFNEKGTVEYNGNNYFLSNTLTYNNLIVNLASPASLITLKSNLTVRNDFTIQQGIFKINDAANNVKYIINVSGNVTIPDDKGQIATGTGDPAGGAYSYTGLLPASGHFHDIYHELNIAGDFINHGIARFTNLTAPLYNNFASNGAVTVRFTGEGDNSVALYGATYFYNLIIDKGSSQAYVTTLYSAASGYFNLFGGNAAGLNTSAPFTANNPEVRKALFIKNGTLKLTGDLLLHSLSEGNMAGGSGDFYIGANASLWIAGNAVSVYSTANDNSQAPAGASGVNTNTSEQGISVLGKLRLTSGVMGTHNSSGIIFRNSITGTLYVEGGSLDVSQVHSTTGGSGKAIYIQSGGNVTIRGDQTEAGQIDPVFPLLAFVNPEDNFRMSGGNITIKDISAGSGFGNNSFYVNSSVDNVDVTAGNVNVDVPGSLFQVYSTASIRNLNIHSSDNAQVTLMMNSDLSVTGDLLVDEHCVIDMVASGVSRTLSISGNLTLGSDGSSTSYFTAGTGTPSTSVIFNGSGNSVIRINNPGTSIFDPFNLVINKNSSSDVVLVSCASGATQPLNIKGDFTVTRGKFDYGSYIVDVKGNLVNQGVMGVWNRQGRIRLNKTSSQQTITGGSGSGILFGHIEVQHNDNSDNNVKLNSNVSVDLLTLTSGRIFIQNYKLSVDTNFVTYTEPGTPSSRMIYSMNDHANRGLQLKLDYNYVNSTVTFPVGTWDGTNYRWGKAVVSIGAIGLVHGYLTIAPVPMQHPSQGGGGCTILAYYWKTIASGLSSVTGNVQYAFSSPLADPGGGAKEFYLMNGVWNSDDNFPATKILTFEAADLHGFATGEFTAGKLGCFNQIKYVYSNGTGGGNWNTGTTWTGGTVPASYDIVVIRSTDSVIVNTNNLDAGKVIINSGGVLDAGTRTGLDYGIIEGGGKFRIASDNGTTPVLPTGDFDPFLLNDTAVFEYYGSGNYTLPAQDYYPTLKIGGTTTSVKTLPNNNIIINHNLLIFDDLNSGVILALSQDAASGYDLTVKGDLKLRRQAVFRFPAAGAIRHVTVNQSIDLSGDNTASKIEIQSSAGTYSNFHILDVKGNILLSGNSLISLFVNTTNRRAVDVYFTGSTNSQVSSVSGSPVPGFNKIFVNKDLPSGEVLINTGFSYSTAAIRPLNITSGNLILNNNAINVALSAGAGSFTIPQNGSLSLRNGADGTITGASTGLILDGILSLENNSSLLIGSGSEDNFIEYGSSGFSSLNISGTALLEVGSQIRRKSGAESGSLKYTQTGGTVLVGKNSAPVSNRAVFEILNTGTFTYTGGNLIIARSQSTAAPSVYLAPVSYSLAGGIDLTFGHSGTPAGSEFGLYSSIPLKDIVISAAGSNKSVKSYSPGLTMDSLIIETGQTFNSAGNDLILKGNLHNSGSFISGNNTTFFSGSRQKLTGMTSFSNLTISSADSVVLKSDIEVTGALNISTGKFSDCSHTIVLKGDYLNSGIQFSVDNSAGGVLINGSVRQKIAGAGIFGRINIDNIYGAELQNDFSLVDRNIYLTRGSLYIRQYRLQLGQQANVVALGDDFSKDKMIITNGALSDKGIERGFNNATVTNFIIPVGVTGKYTPVTISNINSVGNGFFEVRPVNQAHPTVTDQSNVLHYYWNVQVSGFVSFRSKAAFSYSEADVTVTPPSVESDYIPAYLSQASWAKFDSRDINAIQNIIEFNLTESPSGDFTAGISAAIPNSVPVFYTTGDGKWDDPIWAREDGGPAGIPNGYIVKIRHNVEIDQNIRYAYKTIIEPGGVLVLGKTIGHYLGEVSGTGTLSIASSRLPAGNYDNFFTCTGGTMEYTGIDSYEIPASALNYKNLIISGGGTKSIPASDITICGFLQINGSTFDNSANRKITLNGDFDIVTGSFICGTGPDATLVLAGSAAQTISGDHTNDISFNNITINNPGGVVLDNNVNISGLLSLTNGRIITSGFRLRMELSAITFPQGGSVASYVDGPLTKVLSSGSSFTFPIGKGARYGYFTATNTSTSGPSSWTAEYFSSGNPYPATRVSGEYWIVTPPGGTSPVTLRWDSQSDINGLSAGNISNIRIVRYNGSLWQVQNSSVNSGSTNTNGSLTTTSPMSFSDGVQVYFALSSSVDLLPSANFISSNISICRGESVNIQVGLTNGTSWQLFYTVNGAAVNENVNTPLHVLNVTPLVTTTYTLTNVINQVPQSGNASGSVTVTVNDMPNVVINTPSAVCYPATIDLTSSSVTAGSTPSITLSYWLDDAATQVFSNAATAVAGTYYIKGTSIYGCSDIKSVQALVNHPVVVITNPLPVCSPATVDITAAVVTAGSSPGITTFDYWLDAGALNVYTTPATSNSGTYYIRGTDGLGCHDIQPITVTVNPLPSAAISYPGLPWCPNAGAQSVILTGSTGGTYTSTAGLTIDASSGTVLPLASTPADYTVTYTIPPAGGCGSVSATTTVSILTILNWTGTSGTGWGNPANWSCGMVPTSTINVNVPDVVNDPVLGSAVTGIVNNLTMQSGSILSVSGTLKIKGSIAVSGTMYIPGTLVMEGNAPQFIPADVFDGDSIRNLVVDNNACVTLQGPLKIMGSVKLNNGDLASGGNLILASGPGGTGFIYGSDTYNVTGNVTMQRFLDNAYGYSYFSSPFQGAKVSELIPEIPLAQSFPLVYKYVEDRYYSGIPLTGWERYDNADSLLRKMHGYSLNFSNNTPLTVDMTGVVNNGPLGLTLFNHNQQYTQGFNLVGNPYPSAIDWDLVAAMNPDLDNAVYLYDATDRYNGMYSSYVNGVPTGKGSHIIPAMQAFFVHVPDPVFPAVYPVTAVLNMDNSVRIADTQHEFLKKAVRSVSKVETKGIKSLIRLTAGFSDNALTDPIVLYFDEKATGAFDSRLDALKLLNTTTLCPNFYSIANDYSKLSINSIPLESGHLPEIPLGIRTKRNGTIIFRVRDIEGNFPASVIYLYDSYEGTITDITASEYRLYLNSGTYDSRFSLRFENLSTDRKDITLQPVKIYASKGKLNADINCLAGYHGTLKITSLTGQTLLINDIYENSHYEFTHNLQSGIYLISFETKGYRMSQKIFLNP